MKGSTLEFPSRAQQLRSRVLKGAEDGRLLKVARVLFTFCCSVVAFCITLNQPRRHKKRAPTSAAAASPRRSHGSEV